MRTVLIAVTLILMASPAVCQEFNVLDIIGFLYESDNTPGVIGFDESNPGDILAGFGFIDSTGEPFEWSPDDYQYTWHMYDLVSAGAEVIGPNTERIFYTGGSIDIIADPYMDPGYTNPIFGTDPPQSQFLDTFTNGHVFLHGTFNLFALTIDRVAGDGNFQGTISFELGQWFQDQGYELEAPDGYTIGGAVLFDEDGTVPDGFDLSVDGHVYYSPIPNDDVSWGTIKNLFR